MNIRELLDLEDVQFLQEIVKRYPEAKMLAGPAEASPEGNQKLQDTAIAYDVFNEDTPVHETAIEADRTFLGILLFKAAYNEDRSKFPNLSDDNWQGLVSLTKNNVITDEDLELILYALTAQDLGKTQVLVDAYQSEFGSPAADHDKLIYEITAECPDMFEGFKNLSAPNQEAYLNGLAADLNLGQFVQGENLPCNLQQILKIDDRSRRVRLLTELFDFAGATGHVDRHKSILMTNDNYTAFSRALFSLSGHDSATAAYTQYIKSRGQRVGLVAEQDDLASDSEKFALSRIAALSRAFTPEQGQEILDVWSGLPDEDRQTLITEMSITGLNASDFKGILLYYSPAVIANAIKAKGNFSAGLSVGLKALAKTYRYVRSEVQETGLGQVTVNVNALARLAASNPDEIESQVSATSLGDGSFYTLEI